MRLEASSFYSAVRFAQRREDRVRKAMDRNNHVDQFTEALLRGQPNAAFKAFSHLGNTNGLHVAIYDLPERDEQVARTLFQVMVHASLCIPEDKKAYYQQHLEGRRSFQNIQFKSPAMAELVEDDVLFFLSKPKTTLEAVLAPDNVPAGMIQKFQTMGNEHLVALLVAIHRELDPATQKKFVTQGASPDDALNDRFNPGHSDPERWNKLRKLV